jgi:prephenate dehydratase
VLTRVAIYGERGSFAEEAARAFFDCEIRVVFCATLTDLRAAIESDAAERAVLPLENSLAGKVEMTKDFLETVRWRIERNLVLTVRQNLIACKNAKLESLKTVESHPAALAQCRAFFRENPHLRPVESENTAASARRAIESRDATRAAIANARTAEIFGGKILLKNIEDSRENHTKFVLLQK